MIDLEGLSKESGPAVIQIGAVWFSLWEDDTRNWNYGVPERQFFANVTFRSAIEFGLVDGDTLAWWMGAEPSSPTNEARAALFTPPPQALPKVLQDFGDWVRETKPEDKPFFVWSHATYDPPAIHHAFRVTRKPVPWLYNKPRDIRTVLWEAYGNEGRIPGIPRDREHNALWDSWREVLMVQSCYRKIKEDGLHPDTGVDSKGISL